MECSRSWVKVEDEIQKTGYPGDQDLSTDGKSRSPGLLTRPERNRQNKQISAKLKTEDEKKEGLGKSM